MVFQEVEHVVAYAFHLLPAERDVLCGNPSVRHRPQRIIEPHLVIEIVKLTIEDVVAVLGRIVHFCDEDNARMLCPHLRDGPLPKSHRHHFRHVATEAVDLLVGPIQEDV